MSATYERHLTATPVRFDTVVVGVDGSAESREAARQAARLAAGELSLLAAYDPTDGVVGGTAFGVPVYVDEEEPRTVATAALVEARAAVADGRVAGSVVRGRSWDALLHEAERENASLLAVGSHGGGRLAGIVLGSTATELVHKAPCSVLVARPAEDDFPARIVVGVDGSDQSATAYATAVALAERFGASLRCIAADERAAVSELVEASEACDLVVLGSRGLHGLRALGSVSERVAHRAHCSVLIVR